MTTGHGTARELRSRAVPPHPGGRRWVDVAGRPAAGALTLVLLAGCAAGVEDASTPATSSTTSTPPAEQSAAEQPAASRGERSEPTAPRPTLSTAPSPQALPEIPIRDATQVQPARERTAPTRVVVERLGVDMPIDPVGVAPDGQTEVPEDANRAGWYRFGPGLGEREGAMVVLAHNGSEITPRGPFHELWYAEPGDAVRVEGADGELEEFVVQEREVLVKDGLDWSEYFRRDGERSLVLITCGGTWDERASSYRENVVVTATPRSA